MRETVIAVGEKREQLQHALSELRYEQLSLLAMHLAEIDDECSIYQQQIQALLSGDGREADGLVDRLVEVKYSLEHMLDHIQSVGTLLDESLEILDALEE